MSERPADREHELIELIRSVDVPAPERLHRRTEALIARRARDGGGAHAARLRVGAAAALAAAALAVLAVVIGSGRGSGGLTLQSASALALRPSTAAAPAESAARRAQLTAVVDGVAFPYWGERFGWRASGARTDQIGGRTVTTVFYTDPHGRRIGYAIVAGTPAPRIAAGRMSWRGATAYHLTSVGAVNVVTWQRDGHLCVVAGRGVSGATLLRLASWDDRGTPA